MSAEPPLSRRAGRATGRWWNRHGDQVRWATNPARKGWATLVAYLWFAAYCWIGLMLSVAAQRWIGASRPLVMVAAIGGGGVIGLWQARHRLSRHHDPTTPELRRVGLALAAWVAVILLAMAVSAP